MKKRALVLVAALLVPCLLPSLLSAAPAQPATLQQGIDLYQDEQYTESIPLLQKARQEQPASSSAAFFLGMAYKQTGQYEEALANLREAVSLTPRIKEALVELVEVLYRRPSPENTEEAMKWVAIGERERIFPAKIAFLKGLILQQQGKNEEAIASFEQAKAIEPNLGQTVDLQVGMALLKEQKLEQAKVRLQTAIQQSPETDLAGFARQYLDVVEKRIEIEKPLRITLGLFQQYDTNVISKPLDPVAASQAAPGISTSGSAVTATSVRVNYLPKLNGPWLMNAQYAFYANFHDDFATSQDLVNNSLSLTPGYSFGDSSLNLRLDYSNALVRDPSHKQYTDTYTFGPLYRHLIGKAHLLEIFAGYGITEYAKPALDEDEDRDSEGLRGSLSWIWLFRPGAFCNLRYDYDRAATDGRNWDKKGHSYTVNLAYPVFDGVSFQVSGQLYEEDYDHVHSTFLVERDDEKYQGSMGLTWEFMKNASLIGQYTATRQHSNIDIYDYRREAYTAGLEYRF